MLIMNYCYNKNTIMYDQYIIVSICLCMTNISLCQFVYVWPIYHCVNLFMYGQYIIVSICLCMTNILLCHLFMYDQNIIVSICLCMTKISIRMNLQK